MENKVKVLGIEIDNYSATEAMERIIPFFGNDVVNVVKVLYAKDLTAAGENDTLRMGIEHADLTIIGEKALLKAAEIDDKRRIKEVEQDTFLTLFLDYVRQIGSKIHFLAENEEDLNMMKAYFETYHADVQIAGASFMDEAKDADMVVNEINGSDAHVLIACLPFLIEEEFITENRNKLHLNMWLGAGRFQKSGSDGSSFGNPLKRFIEQGLFKRKVTKFKNKEESEE